MNYRPGPALPALFGFLIVLGLGCFAWPGLAWVIAAAGALLPPLLALEAWELAKLRRHVTLRRRLPHAAGRGLAFEERLIITNASARAVTGELRELLPDDARPAVWIERMRVEAGDELDLARCLVITRRGRHNFGPAWVRLRGRLGLLERQDCHDATAILRVLPEGIAAGELGQAGERVRPLDQRTRTRLQGEGTEFHSLNAYRPGDDPRRVDWRASARSRRLIVRRFQLEQHRDVVVLLDCGRLMGAGAGTGTKLDCAVDATLMLARLALGAGDRVGVALFDSRVRGYLPPQSGVAAFSRIRDAIFDAQSRLEETNFTEMFALLQQRQQKRSLIVVLSDFVDDSTTGRFRAALATLRHRHVVLFAALRTPLLREIVAEPVASMRDAARSAVALRLSRERERALHAIERAGVHVLDVEPGELTAPLLNRYVDLRERNLL